MARSQLLSETLEQGSRILSLLHLSYLPSSAASLRYSLAPMGHRCISCCVLTLGKQSPWRRRDPDCSAIFSVPALSLRKACFHMLEPLMCEIFVFRNSFLFSDYIYFLSIYPVWRFSLPNTLVLYVWIPLDSGSQDADRMQPDSPEPSSSYTFSSPIWNLMSWLHSLSLSSKHSCLLNTHQNGPLSPASSALGLF